MSKRKTEKRDAVADVQPATITEELSPLRQAADELLEQYRVTGTSPKPFIAITCDDDLGKILVHLHPLAPNAVCVEEATGFNGFGVLTYYRGLLRTPQAALG